MHADSPLCQSVSTIYCVEAYKRLRKFAADYGSLRLTSTSHSNQLTLLDVALRHDDSRRRQRERVAAANVKPLSQKDQRFSVSHCQNKNYVLI